MSTLLALLRKRTITSSTQRHGDPIRTLTFGSKPTQAETKQHPAHLTRPRGNHISQPPTQTANRNNQRRISSKSKPSSYQLLPQSRSSAATLVFFPSTHKSILARTLLQTHTTTRPNACSSLRVYGYDTAVLRELSS